MKVKNHRDARIRQMHAAGFTVKEISSVFGISAQGVDAVLKKLRAQEEAATRSLNLLEELRLADDLDRKWAVDYLLEALNLSTRARTAVGYWCEWNNVNKLTMRQFMDLVISDKPHAKPGLLIAPLLNVRNASVKTFWETVKRLSEIDPGTRCKLEWKRRVGRLDQASGIVGSRSTFLDNPA